ncbi:MAG: chloride channel protein, partial [Ardenticatenia bacterium]
MAAHEQSQSDMIAHTKWSLWIERLAAIARWHPPEEVILLSTAVFVGIGTGYGAVVFIWLIQQITNLRLTFEQRLGAIGLLLFMVVAGAIVGVMVSRWASEAKGHGVPEVMEAIAVRGGRIRPRVALVKILASGLTIGAGGSAGREGPIVQVGAALGSTVGQFLRFSNDRVQTLVAAGSAAGIAATFNAPIAGSIFALEVILGRFSARNFGAVVISAVSASIISRIYLGDQPAFAVPAYPLHHLGELPIYVVLGLLSAIVAVAFIRVLYALEDFFDEWNIPMPVKTALGLLLTGLVALLLPGRDVLGPGLHMIGEVIAENIPLALQTMAVLLVLKLAATSFT